MIPVIGARLARWATSAVGSGVLAVAALAESVTRTVVTGLGPPLAFVVAAMALGTTVPLSLPRRPAAVTVTALILLSLTLLQDVTVAGVMAQLIVLYRLGRNGDSLMGTALAVPFPVLALLPDPDIATVVLASAAPALVWVGAALRARGEASVHHAARQAIAADLVQHTARGERARIARELHDVVAHHISMISVQAETARLTIADMPAAGAQRLREIGDTARAGLTEMRRLLGVLREDAADDPVERHPQPGLEQLNDLLDESRETSGAATRLIVSGSPVRLDPGVELAAYRIVQEALTNARRHAPGAAVDVELRYRGEVLSVRVRDNGPGLARTEPGGQGLAGMRERAAAVGGELRCGAGSLGGFLVEATLPATSEVTT
ncbi:sensor histidine kinase [Amycolatopsis taiwanensis]|uniref:sensor histidine kinase n=1 Tax=Amycolatopsis taiwanensis TaxID=342230 RepID=UPI0006944834|nr:sensor histidine kinase [Amycolatopsis taiwanensis]